MNVLDIADENAPDDLKTCIRFVQEMLKKHGTKANCLVLALVCGDEAIIDVFTKQQGNFDAPVLMADLVDDARVRLRKEKYRKVEESRSELQAKAKELLPENRREYPGIEVVFRCGNLTFPNMGEVYEWTQRSI